MRHVTLTSNGDGTGRLEIVIDHVRVTERKPGIYDLASITGRIPSKVKCGDEALQPHLVVRLYCKSDKPTRYLKWKTKARRQKLERLHAS